MILPSFVASDSAGIIIAEMVFAVCSSKAELHRLHQFQFTSHAYCDYLEVAGFREEYPVAFLRGLDILVVERRNKGFGSYLLRNFEDWAREKGCGFALAKLGWDADEDEGSDDGESEKKNTYFYQSRGWLLVRAAENSETMLFRNLNDQSIGRGAIASPFPDLIESWHEGGHKHHSYQLSSSVAFTGEQLSSR